MAKIFRYELRRQLISKLFLGLLAVCLYFAWMTLNTVIIQGVANTAPFSPWSYGVYFANLTPILAIALLVGVWRIYSPQARRVQILTNASPVNRKIYAMTKYAAAVLAWLILLLSSVLGGVVYMKTMFGNAVSIKAVLLPCIVIYVPLLLFCLGIGMLLLQCKIWQRALLLLLCVGASFVPLGGYSGLFGATIFSEYPLTLGVLDPAFTLPMLQIMVRIGIAILGCVLLAIGIARESKQNTAST